MVCCCEIPYGVVCPGIDICPGIGIGVGGGIGIDGGIGVGPGARVRKRKGGCCGGGVGSITRIPPTCSDAARIAGRGYSCQVFLRGIAGIPGIFRRNISYRYLDPTIENNIDNNRSGREQNEYEEYWDNCPVGCVHSCCKHYQAEDQNHKHDKRSNRQS